MKNPILAFVVLSLTVLSTPAFAVNPDEVLADTKLEQRARSISENLRCLVCQNQSIDGSDAQLAKDLRVLVRERLTQGDTDKQVVDYIVDRYGEFVLLRPRLSLGNLALWATPIIILLLGGFAARAYNRKSRLSQSGDELSDDEAARLESILKQGDNSPQ